MPRKQTTRQKLHIICERFDFATAPTDVIASYESFPFIIDGEQITDEFVYGIQEFTDLLVAQFKARNNNDSAEMAACYGSALLYYWWKVNVRDNEFAQITEIEVTEI